MTAELTLPASLRALKAGDECEVYLRFGWQKAKFVRWDRGMASVLVNNRAVVLVPLSTGRNCRFDVLPCNIRATNNAQRANAKISKLSTDAERSANT